MKPMSAACLSLLLCTFAAQAQNGLSAPYPVVQRQWAKPPVGEGWGASAGLAVWSVVGASALPLAFALVTDFFFGFTFGLAVGGAGAVGAAFGSALGAGAKVTRWPCREPKIFFSSPGDSAGAAPLVAGAPCATLAAQVVKMTAKVESVFLISWQGDCRVRRKLSSASSRKHRILDTAPARR